MLNTIPIGGNPSGASADEARRRDILAITRESGILIFDDDPYYFLPLMGWVQIWELVLVSPRPRSYLALEQEGVETRDDGRVLRFDSFSKIMAAGMRIGVATGPPPLIQAMEVMTATCQLQPPFTAQAVVQTILAHWGFDSFLTHCEKVARFYLQRCISLKMHSPMQSAATGMSNRFRSLRGCAARLVYFTLSSCVYLQSRVIRTATPKFSLFRSLAARVC